MIIKKLFFSSLALVAMMFAGTSCSSEEVAPVTGESAVTLSVTLPDGIQSRAFGDGHTAQKLTMLVLDQNNQALPVFDGGANVLNTEINLTKQVNLRLAAGKTYKVVCWAAAEGAPYTFNTTDFTVSAEYEGVKTSDEALDAFYAVQDITVQGNTTETIKLYRPFAQLNIGTDDLAAAKAAGFDAKTVKVTVPTYKSLNLVTGAVEAGDPVAVPFGEGALPTGETFPKAGYEYLSMNYLLMSADKQLVDLEFTVKAADGSTRTLPVSAVPVQRNYRTNIYGSLLTNSVNINVEIVPAFEERDYEMDDVARVVAALSAGKSVKLDQDLNPGKTMVIDLKDGASVTLDLNGHTIANTTDLWNEETGHWSLISVRGNGTLTIKGGTLKAKENDCFALDVFDKTANLIIEDGKYVGNLHAVYVYFGNLKVKGGEFSIQQLADGKDPYRFTLNCYDSSYKSGIATVEVSGGKFFKFNPGDNLAEGKGTNFLAPGYKAEAEGDYYKVVSIPAVTTQADFEKAVKIEGASVVVGKNLTVTLPQDIANGVTIIGMEGATIDNTIFKHWDTANDNCIYNKENLTFKNLNIKENNVNYAGLVRCNNVTYDKCTIEGKMFLNGEGFVFDRCKFVQTVSDYNIWTYGGNPVTFNDCVFECAGKSVLVYNEGGVTPVVNKFNNCKFVASQKVAGKAAIEIDQTSANFEVEINGCTATGFDNGSVSGNPLWNNKSGIVAKHTLVVKVDGVTQTLKNK
mgnify:CR=1 FL=1